MSAVQNGRVLPDLLALTILERENAELRERCAELERVLMDKVTPFAVLFGLTPTEERMFAALMARDQLSAEQLRIVTHTKSGWDDRNPKIVDVLICTLRKKVRPFDIEIRTMWGRSFGAGGTPLPAQMARSFWATPTVRDAKNANATPYATRGGTRKGEQLVNQIAHLAPLTAHGGLVPSGLTAKTGRRGGANPEHPCWLMGFPAEWVFGAWRAMRSFRASRRR